MRTLHTFAITCAALGCASAATAAPLLSIEQSEEYGAYLVGPDGRPVYVFETEIRGGDDLAPLESCLEPCRGRWPPVYASNGYEVAEGLQSDLALTIEDDQGDVAAYNGEPLFYFHMDEPGKEPQGQGVHSFGGWWFLMSPDGEYIDTSLTE